MTDNEKRTGEGAAEGTDVRRTSRIQGLVLDSRYVVEEKIGVGGMAVVYRGTDNLLARSVAIKILHENFAGDEAFVARFKREAQAAGKLTHPNIVGMYDVGMDQGYHYIIMEYVGGETLKEYITRHGRLSIDSAVGIATDIASGLEHAHAMGIVHCDIKPHNILMTADGRVKVTDFGIARAINTANNTVMLYTTSVMGSAHYLSPEQANGKSVDGSTDIYSLGVVLYEMLTGRVPYEGDTPVSVALKHVQERLTPPSLYNPDIPVLLESAVMKALEKQPDNRFASVTEMITAIRLSGGSVGGRSARIVPQDFATQVIPTVKERPAKELVGYEFQDEKKDDGDQISGLLNRLPQKYIIAGSVVAFIIAFLWAFLSFGNFWSNSEIPVPNVVGKQRNVAEHMLDDNRLRVSISEVSNPDIPSGQVISQNPEAGTAVKEQRVVHLVVSKGPGDIKMPELKGLTQEQARERLKDAGIVIGKVLTVARDNESDGVIVVQEPAAGSKVSKGAAVDITVNKRPVKDVAVPNVIDMELRHAREAVAKAGLTIATIHGTVDESSVVTVQDPTGGTLPEGSGMTLTTEAKDAKKSDKDTDKKSNASGITKGTVDITVPSGAKNQKVRIEVVDDNGSAVVYDGTNAPGERIVKDVAGSGQVRIRVYLNNALVQDQAL